MPPLKPDTDTIHPALDMDTAHLVTHPATLQFTRSPITIKSTTNTTINPRSRGGQRSRKSSVLTAALMVLRQLLPRMDMDTAATRMKMCASLVLMDTTLVLPTRVLLSSAWFLRSMDTKQATTITTTLISHLIQLDTTRLLTLLAMDLMNKVTTRKT